LNSRVGQFRLDGFQLGIDLSLGVGVVGFGCQLQQDLGVVDALPEIDPRRDLVAEPGQLFERRLRPVRVVPEIRRGGGFFELRYLLLLGSEVKDAPEGRRRGRAGH
jgi:hypothetical protein